MYFKELHVVNFKNYETVHFEFHPTLNVLYGLNGMGKTNILDALNYLCMVKSNFHVKDSLAIRNGQDFMRLHTTVFKDQKDYEVILKYIRGGTKELSNQKKVYERLSDHIGLFPVVFSAPKDIHLITGGSADRRNLLDRVLCQLDEMYLKHLGAYKNLLRRRNALLKLVQSAMPDEHQRGMLESYTEKMKPSAQYIYLKRKQFTQSFQDILSKRYAVISKGAEKVKCMYVSELDQYTFDVLADKNHSMDLLTKRTNAGIHKDDLEFSLDGFLAKERASQGQLKSLMLALKLAFFDVLFAEKKDRPVLLLDDIFAKLDNNRIFELIQLLIRDEMGQIFITDTSIDRIENILQKIKAGYRTFEIENGAIKQQKHVEG